MIFGRGRHSSFILAVRSISKIPKFLQSIVFAIWRASAFKLPLLCAVNRHLQLQIHSYAWDWVSERACICANVQLQRFNNLCIPIFYSFFTGFCCSKYVHVRLMHMPICICFDSAVGSCDSNAARNLTESRKKYWLCISRMLDGSISCTQLSRGAHVRFSRGFYRAPHTKW